MPPRCRRSRRAPARLFPLRGGSEQPAPGRRSSAAAAVAAAAAAAASAAAAGVGARSAARAPAGRACGSCRTTRAPASRSSSSSPPSSAAASSAAGSTGVGGDSAAPTRAPATRGCRGRESEKMGVAPVKLRNVTLLATCSSSIHSSHSGRRRHPPAPLPRAMLLSALIAHQRNAYVLARLRGRKPPPRPRLRRPRVAIVSIERAPPALYRPSLASRRAEDLATSTRSRPTSNTTGSREQRRATVHVWLGHACGRRRVDKLTGAAVERRLMPVLRQRSTRYRCTRTSAGCRRGGVETAPRVGG